MLNGAEGVGLYRMERVYLGRVVPPNAAPLICGLSRFQISNKFFKAPLGYDYIINSAGFLQCSGIQYTIRTVIPMRGETSETIQKKIKAGKFKYRTCIVTFSN
jgi:hypothetical protein